MFGVGPYVAVGAEGAAANAICGDDRASSSMTSLISRRVRSI
jgi:hypothetical protein